MMKLILFGCLIALHMTSHGYSQDVTADRRVNAKSSADDLFLEKTRIIHRFSGESGGSEFGWVARVVGDIDQDGTLDFVATAPSFNGGNGKIYVYSSKRRKLLFDVEGVAGQRLGNGASGAGDVDGDKIPDVLVGAPLGDSAFVYSGKTGESILKLSVDAKGSRFGYKVCALGDVDGDQHSDVFVTAIAAKGKQDRSGAGFAYSGTTGKQLFRLEGERTGDKFGSAAAATSDGNDVLLAVGAQDAGKTRGGKVYVYRLTNGKPKLAFEIAGDMNSVNLGQMFVSFPGDSNQDGVPDVYASDFSDKTAAPGAGKIVVHSGKDGSQIFEISGKQPGEGFGTSPSDAGDVNGDGVGDLVIGAWQNRKGAKSGGRVSLHDGRDGKELDAWTCASPGDTFGFDAVGIGDVDGDGNIDFLLTSAWANIDGPKTGQVFIIAGENYQQ